MIVQFGLPSRGDFSPDLDAVQEFPAIDCDFGRSFDPKPHVAFCRTHDVDGYVATWQDNLLAYLSRDYKHLGILSVNGQED